MTYTSVSPKYQVVIPKEVRSKVGLKPRQRLIVMEKAGIIYLIPDVPLKDMKGCLQGQGLKSSGLRDKQDRL
jgi:AbrB family looped-hinge helix DNA binding protein